MEEKQQKMSRDCRDPDQDRAREDRQASGCQKVKQGGVACSFKLDIAATVREKYTHCCDGGHASKHLQHGIEL